MTKRVIGHLDLIHQQFRKQPTGKMFKSFVGLFEAYKGKPQLSNNKASARPIQL